MNEAKAIVPNMTKVSELARQQRIFIIWVVYLYGSMTLKDGVTYASTTIFVVVGSRIQL